MKTQGEMMAYFKSMPKREKTNPYWKFQAEHKKIIWDYAGESKVFVPGNFGSGFDTALIAARDYFRLVYQSFGTEAQVLCLNVKDAPEFAKQGVPRMEGVFRLAGLDVSIFVPPQFNTPVNSIVSEIFWQEYIAGKGIVPVARIHSHHKLDAYQSSTDYSTLNSNTLEIVMGHIMDASLHIAFWLDEHGKDTKEYVFQADEYNETGEFSVKQIPSGNPGKKQ